MVIIIIRWQGVNMYICIGEINGKNMK